MKNILIIGCGLIGSSILRSIQKNRVCKKIFVYEKSKKNITIIKKLKLPCTVIKDFKKVVPNMDLIIFCTPMSQYEKIMLKINKYLNTKTIITDVSSAKKSILELINKKLKKKFFGYQAIQFQGQK